MSDAVKLTGLWKSDKPTANGTQFYKGKLASEVTIPAGAMICLFLNESENPRAPKFQLTFLPPSDEHDQRREQEDRGGLSPWETESL